MLSFEDYKSLLKYRNGPVSIRFDEFSPSEKYLFEQKLIESAHLKTEESEEAIAFIPDSFRITHLGENALYAFENEREKQSKAERQQRFQNKVSVASVLVPAITFLLGLLVEHFSGITGWLFAFLF